MDSLEREFISNIVYEKDAVYLYNRITYRSLIFRLIISNINNLETDRPKEFIIYIFYRRIIFFVVSFIKYLYYINKYN